jgi:hypothetical protein
MLGNDPAVLADHDAIRIGVDLDRTTDRADSDRVFVVIEAYQAGLRDRGRQRMDAVDGITHIETMDCDSHEIAPPVRIRPPAAAEKTKNRPVTRL